MLYQGLYSRKSDCIILIKILMFNHRFTENRRKTIMMSLDKKWPKPQNGAELVQN